MNHDRQRRQECAITMRLGGASYAEISNALGVSDRAVRRYCESIKGRTAKPPKPAPPPRPVYVPPRPSWPAEREAKAIAMALAAVPMTEIARRLGTTKNAVVGALDRAKCAGRFEPLDPERRLAIQFPNPCPSTVRQRLARELDREDPVTLEKRLGYALVTQRGCVYVIGDPRASWHWCGSDTEGHRSYCPQHRAKVFVPAKPAPDVGMAARQ